MIGKAEDPIIKRNIGRKQTQIVYSRDGSDKRVKTILTPDADAAKPCFSDEEAKTIAEWCVKIEKHYSKHHGHPTPMDIEWAKDGITGELFIVQARPETVRSAQMANVLKQTQVTEHEAPILEGSAIGSDAASGKARVIRDVSQISQMQPGEILVADMTDPDWVPGLRIASGVVTNRGGRTCHAAIVSRELGVPCIVGTKDATETLKTGEDYTIDCSKGSNGLVYPGVSKIERTSVDMDSIPKTNTEIKLILGDPDAALSLSSLPVAGVGLVRQEFVVANHIGVHPKAVLHPELVSPEDREVIAERAKNDPSPKAWFIRKLSEGVGSIAAAFYPRPVLVRLGDFKVSQKLILCLHMVAYSIDIVATPYLIAPLFWYIFLDSQMNTVVWWGVRTLSQMKKVSSVVLSFTLVLLCISNFAFLSSRPNDWASWGFKVPFF